MTTRRPIRRALAGLLAVALVLQGPGCAFLFHKNQNMKVGCNVPDALITINGKQQDPGKTTFPLRTGDDHTITAEAPGYLPKTIVVKGRQDFAVRFLIFDALWVLAYGAGIVFLIVDASTGCLWDHTPAGRVDLVLEPEPDSKSELASLPTQPERPRQERPRPAPANPLAPPPNRPPVTPPVTPLKPPPPAPKTEPVPVAPPPPPPPPPGRTRILAVGSEAATATLCALTAAPDAKRLTGALATRQAILREIREHLERHVGSDDRAILYLGCGLSWEDDELYLTTADTDPDQLAETAIPASTLTSYLERVEGALVLVVVNGPIADTVPAADALALDGALLVVGEGDLASRLTSGLRPDGADTNGDARVNGVELSIWLRGHGSVRGGAAGALPVQR